MNDSLRLSRRRFLMNAARGSIGAMAMASTSAGLGWRFAVANASQKIRIGYLPISVLLSVYSDKVGFWRGADLDVDLFRAQGGPAILQALLSGDIPMGEIGVGPAIVTAARGFPLYFPTLTAISTPELPLDRILVRQDSSIRQFADLRGKTLAINQLGTMPDAALGAAEKVFGVAKSDLKLVPIPYPNMPQVLAAGQVDAIYAFPPGDTIAERRFGARTVTNTTDFIPYLGYSTLAIRRDFADNNPAIVRKIISGGIRGSRWLGDHREDALKIAADFLKIPADVAKYVRPPYWARNALPVMANVWHLYYLQLAGGIIKPIPDVEKVFDSYFVQPAMKFTLPALEETGIEPDAVFKEMLKARYPMLPKPAQEYPSPWDDEILKR